MRKIIAEVAVSLDGFIEGPSGELDWFTPIAIAREDDETHGNGFLSRFDTIFYGRVAYEKFGMYTVDASMPEAEQQFRNAINNMRKYVLSKTARHVPGNGMVISDEFGTQIKRIRDEEGKNIWLCGGASAIKTFAGFDLIDEYTLAVHPVVLGGGKSLFDQIPKPMKLKLIGSRQLKSGIVILNYKPSRRK